ncbi:uncharacterized protein LOC124137040 [Haliotis rufescens]|uniref:uncharacterized protein LOC124137040 n=1 Tax=Haliotis rufescens TaxID=6454 RepID=UPI00201EFF75|nr:uncharacterized protein LOC124137040 [Haliotis rufescens]
MHLYLAYFPLKTLLFLGVSCSGYAETKSTGDLYIRDAVSSWKDARSACSGDLYVPSDGSVPGTVSAKLLLNTYYWIGAIQYSTWRWTQDNSPLYTYIGLRTLPLGLSPSTSNAWNSVYLCHIHCGQECTVLGLRMNECYCLSTDEDVSLPEVSTEVSCPGNPDEKCGNNSGLSVYKLEGITFRPTKEGHCVYATRLTLGASFSQVNQTLCGGKRRYACFENSTTWMYGRCSWNICITQRKYQKNWTDASATCPLVKVTSSNRDNLTAAMHTGDEVSYWIGLSRPLSSKWINGTTSARYGTAFPDSTGPKCLAMIADRWQNIDRLWVPCDLPQRSICETASPSSIPPRTPTSSATTTDIVTTALMSTMTEMFTSEGSDENVTETTDGTESSTLAPPADTGGLLIGVAVGCLTLLLVVVVTVYVMFRHRKLCFKKTGKFEPLDSTAVENETYGFHFTTENTFSPAAASPQHRSTSSPQTTAASHHHSIASPPTCGTGRSQNPIYDNAAISDTSLNANDECRIHTNIDYDRVTLAAASHHHPAASPPPPTCGTGRTHNPIYDNAAISNTPLNAKDGSRIPFSSDHQGPSAHAYDYLASSPDRRHQTRGDDTEATGVDTYNHVSYEANQPRYKGDYNTVVTREAPSSGVGETDDVYIRPIVETDANING